MIKVMISTIEGYHKIRIYLPSAIALVYHNLNIISSKHKNSKGVYNIRKQLIQLDHITLISILIK